MRESTDICLRTTRSSIVRPIRVSSARRPSSAIPRLTEMKTAIDDETHESLIDNASIASSSQTMNIYLRLKPRFTKAKRMKKIQDDTYVVTSPTSLLTKFPSLEGSTNCAKKSKSPERTSRTFNFTKIFVPETTQSEFFEQTTKQRIIDFLGGQSFTLMTYGTTNSGKSHTIHGNSESPGIIPRSIEFLFSGVNCTLSPWYKPIKFSEVASLNETERCQEIEARERMLTSRLTEKSICEEVYGSLENSMNEETECDKNGEAMYSVWLSFVEIYNDNIYDLLVDDEARGKLTPLKLATDKQGRTFVQGLRMICVTTGLEAYRILMVGRSRLTIGSTSLNSHSSRSHSIFTVKLLKYVKERAPEEVESCTMTFCDLAGTGKSRKSTATGNELKETKSINTSLLVLGRCLKVASDCQTSKQNVEVIGPFRESKLTRLFQRSILGKENLYLIVNVDSSPELYVETLAVLTFAAIAKKIVIDSGRDAKRSNVTDLLITSPKISDNHEPKRPTTVGRIESSEKPEIAIKLDVEELKDRNVCLTKEIAMLRETALHRECEIRQEMGNLYAGIIKDVEANWQKRTKDVEEENDDFLKWSVKQIEIFYKERIDSLTNRKRRRISGGDQRDDGKELCSELESENSQITAKVVALRQTIKKLKEEQDILSADKSKCVFELSLAKNTIKQLWQLLDDERGEKILINDDDSQLVEDLRSLINEKNESIRNLKKCLEDTRNECVNEAQNSADKDEKIVRESSEVKITSILESLTLEELKNELAKRTQRIYDEKQSIGFEILEESIIIEEKEIDAKFSSSTFRKESNDFFLPSSTRYSIIEAENSILGDETTRTVDSLISFGYPSLQTDETTKNLHFSFLGTIDDIFIDERTKDDSGIAVSNVISSSTENSVCHVTEEKSSQTNFENFEKNVKINEIIQERVEELKIDYNKLKSEHFQETIRVTELSQALESIKYALDEFKESTRQNELKIIDYQQKLASRENDLSILGRSKIEIEAQLCDVTRQLETRSITYEEKIGSIRDELKIHQDNENRALKSLEEYQEKSSCLESQLALAYVQIDNNSMKCLNEHVPKIEKLERELSAKSQRISEMNEKMHNFEIDLGHVDELNVRVTKFSTIVEEYQREKDELRRQLLERLETQSSLECKIKRLTSKVYERENEISSLRMDLGNVVKMNLENSDRARELSKEIAIANDRLSSVKAEMLRSEEERRKLERTSGHEIGNLIARLGDFEKNATILARMRDNEESRVDELDRVKLLLHDKEREMCLFKKNRDKTVRRYEALIRKLQADVEMRCNNESSKLRILYPKKSISKDSLRSMAESLRWKSTLRQSVEKVRSSQGVIGSRKCRRWQSSDRCDHRCSRTYPTRSTIMKRSSSHAMINSSTSMEGSRSSGSRNLPLHYDDEDDDDDDEDDDERAGHEIIETESRTELNLDIIECRGCGRRDGLSQAAAIFGIPSTSDESFTDYHDVPEWMEIRRTNGRTHFRMRKSDSGIVNSGKPRT